MLSWFIEEGPQLVNVSNSANIVKNFFVRSYYFIPFFSNQFLFILF